MKKFTGIVIIMALVLMQNVDQTEGFGEFSDRIMINKYISHAFAKNEDPKINIRVSNTKPYLM